MAQAFADLPLPDISSKKKDVKLTEAKVPVASPSGMIDVFYQEASPRNAPSGRPSLLLLHGMMFTSDTWRKLDTLQTLCSLGYRAVAIDLPGYGKTRGNAMEKENAAAFIDAVINAMHLTNPIIVSPSMSGHYSLPYVLGDGTRTKVSGYIPVAPVTTEQFPRESYAKFSAPVMIVYGQNDARLGEESLKNLSGFPNKHVVCFEGAGHACYLDKQDLWHKCLYNFLHKCFSSP